jgi:hypothetical protein
MMMMSKTQQEIEIEIRNQISPTRIITFYDHNKS